MRTISSQHQSNISQNSQLCAKCTPQARAQLPCPHKAYDRNVIASVSLTPTVCKMRTISSHLKATSCSIRNCNTPGRCQEEKHNIFQEYYRIDIVSHDLQDDRQEACKTPQQVKEERPAKKWRQHNWVPRGPGPPRGREGPMP